MVFLIYYSIRKKKKVPYLFTNFFEKKKGAILQAHNAILSKQWLQLKYFTIVVCW
jgi:hypothetical protein